LLWTFRWCFTEPSFRTFTALVAGMVAQPARRTVCGMLVGAGASQVWHHSRAHWFFSRARWSVEQIGLVLASLIVDRLLSPDAPVLLAVDDTLMRRSGRKRGSPERRGSTTVPARHPKAARCHGEPASW
jgi:hypothetical protein